MYINREDAGTQLGQALEPIKPHRPILLGIPRGGVEVGFYAARHLDCDFDTIVVRKLGYPQQPEAAFGALAEDGSLYLDPWSDKYLNKEIIQEVIKKEQQEIQRRIKKYRLGNKFPSLSGRVVVLVDDGIATGATVFAALLMCRKQSPQKLIVAAPISGLNRLSKLEHEADEVIIPEKHQQFTAVSQGYRDFLNLSDEEVLHFMQLWRSQKAGKLEPPR